MNSLLEQRIQNGTYWSGVFFGSLVMLLVVLVIDRLNQEPNQNIISSINMPKDVVEAYRMGIKDAMKINPPSLELEQTCMDMWANKQPVREQ